MKKMIFGLALLAGACAFAGIDNVVVTFSTKGPDKYADGNVVTDGEIYALVWVKDGAKFAGIDANGDAVDGGNSRILLKAPVAKGGHCPNIQFEIDETYYRENGLAGGKLFVYLLDTRRFKLGDDGVETDGNGRPIVTSVGDASGLVNGYGAATDDIVCSGFAAANLSKSAKTGEAAAVPEKGKQLKIRDIKLLDGNVYIYVSGSLQSMRYRVKMGKLPGGLKENVKQLYGNDKEDLIIITPQKEASAFFSVESL